MCRQIQTDRPSRGCHSHTVSLGSNAVGDIMRHYGERYIRAYSPPLQHIKLIRSMRLCRTPAMGGKAYVCKSCQHGHYVYFGCGRSLCCICQGVKRHEWLLKMQSKLLKVPYVHLVTTMPHQLNSLARRYPKQMYSLMFVTTAATVKHFERRTEYLGASTGMISVLHTFGSDMKYHVHVHSLLTFGGLKQGKWVYPKHNKRLCKHREFRDKFRELYIKGLEVLISKGEIEVNAIQSQHIEDLKTKSWSYRVTAPAMDTEHIELYLARYINRIAITNSRVQQLNDQVVITYTDYRNAKQGEKAPKATKDLHPLEFIHQYLQHVPPPYFQRVRYYGLHSAFSFHKIKKQIPHMLRCHGRTIRTVMEIITHLLKQESLKCSQCQHDKFEEVGIPIDRNYIKKYIKIPPQDPLKTIKPHIRSP